MDRLNAGSLFGERYEIIRCIGVGGMGAVYEARHVGTRRRAALKVLLPGLLADGDARQRFAVEASITATIESEHLVEVFDAGIDRATGAPFIVMELLKGASLGHRLQHKQKFSATQVLEIVGQVARALEKTHAAGVVHRDLKPDNLFLVDRPDGAVFVKVLDFGIAKAIAAGASRNTTNIGTPIYMAPEQLEGTALDARADVFSLGHIAFELLTGEHYWEPELRAAPSAMALMRIIDRGYPEAASLRARRLGVTVAESFDAWFSKATARAVDERYRTPSELVEGFAEAIGLAQYAPTIVMQLPSELATALQAGPVPAATSVGFAAARGPTGWNMVSTRPSASRSRVVLAVALGCVLSGVGVLAAVWGLLLRTEHTTTSTDATVVAGSPAEPSAAGSVAPEGTASSGVSVAPASVTASSSASAPVETSSATAGTASAPPASTSAKKPSPKPPAHPKGCAKDPRRCR